MEQIDAGKLPKNIEAEQALLGAILQNNKSLEKISEFLRPEHFADSTHQKIYEIISKLIINGHSADVITLKDYMTQQGTLDRVGGVPYLMKLADSASPFTNVEDYAQFIYDKYLRRELINTGYNIVNSAVAEDIENTAVDQIEAAEKALFNLADQGNTQG
jgi:replicative DNA helicase